jgi:Tfp pilus assembly protein PilO
MTRIQQWAAGTVVALLVIVAAGWFLAISPQKHKVSSLGAQSAAQEQTNTGLHLKLTELTAQMSAVPSEEAAVAAVTQKIPNDPAMPDYVRTLTTIASQTGVELVSIAPGAPATVTVAAATVPAAAAATPSASASASAAVQAAPAAPAVSLQSIPVALNVQGGYFQIQQFTAALQRLARSTVVTSIAIAPGGQLKPPKVAPPAADAYKSLTAAISVDVFMNSTAFDVPAAPAQASDATVPGAAAASAAPAVPSVTASPSN